MRLKQKIMKEVTLLLHETGSWIMSRYYSEPGETYKVTRGENHLDMPYLVLDTPQLRNRELAGKLRIMVWWGHYIGLQYFVKAGDVPAALAALKGEQASSRILVSDNLFDNDIEGPGFMRITDYREGETALPPVTKLARMVPLSGLPDLQKHVASLLGSIRSRNEASPHISPQP